MPWNDYRTDAFWGPSIHWNTHLQCYVMLVARTLPEPRLESGGNLHLLRQGSGQPQELERTEKVARPEWYPQVLGTDVAARETDKLCGRHARLFLHGTSREEIYFLRDGEDIPRNAERGKRGETSSTRSMNTSESRGFNEEEEVRDDVDSIRAVHVPDPGAGDVAAWRGGGPTADPTKDFFVILLEQKREVPEPLSASHTEPGFKIRGTKGWRWTPEQMLAEVPFLARCKMNFFMNCYTSLYLSNGEQWMKGGNHWAASAA